MNSFKFDIEKYSEYSHTELNNKLLFATEKGCISTIKFIIDSKNLMNHVDINYVNELGINALMIASSKGNMNILKYLIHNNIDIVKKDRNGHDVLWYAVKYKQLEVIKYLIENVDLERNKFNLMNAFLCSVIENNQILIHYFIINLNISINSQALSFLKGDNLLKKKYVYVLNLLKNKERFIYLNKTLKSCNKEIDKIIKI